MIKYLKNNILISISILSLILLLIPIVVFLFYFGNMSISKDLVKWASFGDFFGGILNTILSFCSLIILGLLTHTVSKQSNDENKKINLLIKRLDSFEKLTDYMTRLNQIMAEMSIDLGDITHALNKNNDEVNHRILQLEMKTKFFIELHTFIMTFGIRFGHLYSYDFESKEFISLSENIAPTLDYFSQILLQIKKRQYGFPAFPAKENTLFIQTFAKVVTQLKTELH